ncbi:AAA family ATPase [Brachybacterium sp. AOP43-C2-M15]|uniref:AAA family ATPase n=1 Tax=Brachybacterium sp. AOP43-C2-M15 TaxID=3457661 RepID=UPI00403420F9
MERSRVHVMGASGSGTTTLARALADRWSVPHADADDYFWRPTAPPYTQKRPAEERTALMTEVFVPREAWVLSGSMLGWGEDVVDRCDAVVFLTLDPAQRMRRLEERERVRREGQEIDRAAWSHFLDWARSYDDPSSTGRSRAVHEAWLRTLEKPVLRLDSDRPVGELVEAVLRWAPR